MTNHITLYAAVSGLFARPVPAPPSMRESEHERSFEPLPPPVQLGEVTEEGLRVYDGSDPKKPLLMAIKGQIYDVTQSRTFYGPGGPYALFAGRDASRALAKMSFEPSDLTGDISGLSPFEVEALQEWEYKFMSKYVKVGTIKKSIPVLKGDAVHAGISGGGIDASTSRGSAVDQPAETSHVGVSTSSHEDSVQKLNELPGSDLKSRNSHDDAVEKQNKTSSADLKNASITDDEGEPKGTPNVEETNISNLEDVMEKPIEAPDVDVKEYQKP